MKKFLILPFLLISLFAVAQNESMDSTTLDAFLRNKDSMPWTHYLPLKNAIISLNKRVAPGGSGISSLNGLTPSTQTFATGTSGTDFGISSAGSVHTFNIPDANGTTARGLVSTGTQTLGGSKTFSSDPTFSARTATQVIYMGTGGLVSGSNNFVWDNTNQRLSIAGGTTNAPPIALTKTLGSLTQNFITMTDGTSSKTIIIGDGATSGFLPFISFIPDGTTQNETHFDVNCNDAGSTAALVFRLRNLAGSGSLATQPLVEWQNLTSRVMVLNKDGLAFPDGILTTGANSGSDSALIRNGSNGKIYIAPSVSPTNTVTLTNKRINKRITTTGSTATGTPSADTDDMYTVTNLAQNITFSAPSGTPTEGQVLIIRIKDNATPRTITWNAIYRAGNTALPTTTTTSKWLYCEFMYNNNDSKWDFVSTIDGF